MNKELKKKSVSGIIKIAFCGGCMSGNMGGPAMYISMANLLKEYVKLPIEFTVISKYPKDDFGPVQSFGWKMISYPTWKQVVFGLPFSIVVCIFRIFGIRPNIFSNSIFKPYIESDLLIDFSGISFSDDRPFSGLIINCLWLIPAISTQIAWMKCSQAMGPFNKKINRIFSKYILNDAKAIITRGNESYQYTKTLLPYKKNIFELPDIAFCFSPSDKGDYQKNLKNHGISDTDRFIVVSPSSVLDSLLCSNTKLSYKDMIRISIEKLLEISQIKILLLSHARANTGTYMDDFDICQEIYKSFIKNERVILMKGVFSADTLKLIISHSEIAIGSRFHFVVAALSSGIPSLSITWSHKYREMMGMLGQENYAIHYKDVSKRLLSDKINLLWTERKKIQDEIIKHLDGVKDKARQNARIATDLISQSIHK